MLAVAFSFDLNHPNTPCIFYDAPLHARRLALPAAGFCRPDPTLFRQFGVLCLKVGREGCSVFGLKGCRIMGWLGTQFACLAHPRLGHEIAETPTAQTPNHSTLILPSPRSQTLHSLHCTSTMQAPRRNRASSPLTIFIDARECPQIHDPLVFIRVMERPW